MTWNPKDDIYKHFAMIPDRELEDWERFVTIRELDVTKLGQRTMRPPADLVMHGPEKVRAQKEWKQVIENAELSKKVLYEDPNIPLDAYRLKPRCCCEDNVYEMVRPKLERHVVEEIEHVGCPDHILKTEKGMHGQSERKPCLLLDATFHDYRDKRERELQEEIKLFDPFRSDLSQLIVIGRKPQTPPPKPPRLPTVTLTAPLDPPLEASCGIYALRINNTVLIKDIPNQSLQHLKMLQKEPWHEFCYTWTYYLNNSQSKLGEAKLFLKNLGTVAIKYCWQKINKLIPFIIENTNEQKFFFNKGENIINPGQSTTIYFTFLSEHPCTYCETWKLNTTNVCFFDNNTDKLTVELIGDCSENIKKINYSIAKLQYRIERKVTRKFVFDFICEAIERATGLDHQYYPYKKYLLEAQIFVSKNPMCFYHQTQVQLLKDLYVEMTNGNWDLTILSWRKAMKAQPFEERMTYYNQLKRSYLILLKPWCEGDSIFDQKCRAVRTLLGALADKFYDEMKRISKWNGAGTHAAIAKSQKSQLKHAKKAKSVDSVLTETNITANVIQNEFYLHMYDHVAYTMELIAAMINSIDLNRWIEFDFCAN